MRLAAALLLTLMLTSCSSRSSAPLRIGISEWPPYEFLHLARERGFFEQEGVDVRLVEFAAMSDARRAFEHRQIDGGLFSIFETLHVRDDSRRDLKIALVIDFSDGADAILARPGIDSVAALRGKRFGIAISALNFYMADRALASHGLTLEDVTIVPVEDIDMARYLSEGKVDAVVNYPPSRTRIEQAGLARAIFTSAEIPGEIVDVLALDETVSRERPQDVARLIRAFYRAVEYARTHPQDAYRIMAAREHIEPEAFRESISNGITLVRLEEQERFLAPDAPFSQTVKRIAQVLHRTRQISNPAVADNLLSDGPARLAANKR